MEAKNPVYDSKNFPRKNELPRAKFQHARSIFLQVKGNMNYNGAEAFGNPYFWTLSLALGITLSFIFIYTSYQGLKQSEQLF